MESLRQGREVGCYRCQQTEVVCITTGREVATGDRLDGAAQRIGITSDGVCAAAAANPPKVLG